MAELEREIAALHFWIMLRYASGHDFAVYCNKLVRKSDGNR